jgi:hypothetical protein
MYESDYQRRLEREANEADARRGTDRPMTRSELLKALAEEVEVEFLSPEGHERVRKSTEEVLSESFDALEQAGKESPGCTCSYSQAANPDMTMGPVRRHVDPECPVHGEKTDESA